MRPILLPIRFRSFEMVNLFVLLSLMTYVGASQLTTCPCGWANKAIHNAERIIGGTLCEQNEFPFIAGIVLLKKDGTYRPFCGGTIISTNYVLTAAHCLDRRLKDTIGVLLGSHDRCHNQDRSEVIRVSSKVLHPDFQRYYGQRSAPIPVSHDIALLALEQQITFNAIIGPACLPLQGLDVVGKLVTVIGWGAEVYGGPFKSKMTSLPKKTVGSHVISDYQCSVHWDIHDRGQLCTIDSEGIACRGDSGGPVVYFDPDINRYTLVGVVSFVPKGCTTKKPSVHTRVEAYIPWILEQMDDNESSQLCTKSGWEDTIDDFSPEFMPDDVGFDDLTSGELLDIRW